MRCSCHGAPLTMCDGHEVVWRVLKAARLPAETLRRIVIRFRDHMQSCHLSLFIVGSCAHFNCVELKCRSLWMRSCCHGAPLTMWSCRLHIGHTADTLVVKLYSVFWQLQNYLRNQDWSFNRIISNDLIKPLSRFWLSRRYWWWALRFLFLFGIVSCVR